MSAQQKKVLEDEMSAKGVKIGLLITLGLLVLLLGSFLAMGGLLRGLDIFTKKMSAAIPANAQIPVIPPNPHLQINPKQDLSEKFLKERQHLNAYGWVDRERGIAHIPIDRAMELMLKSPQIGRAHV